MLRALAAHGIVADVVFGSSVGALNGAYYAGIPTIEGIKQLEAIWRGLHRRDVFQVTWRTMLGFVRRRDFLATSEGLRQLIDKHLPYRNLEDAKIPIHIVATDVLSGETAVLSKGPAAQAILASAAIPPAFAPASSKVCTSPTAPSPAIRLSRLLLRMARNASSFCQPDMRARSKRRRRVRSQTRCMR